MLEKDQVCKDLKQARSQLDLNKLEIQSIKDSYDDDQKQRIAELLVENRQALTEKEEMYHQALEQLREQYDIRISELNSKVQDYVGKLRLKDAAISNLEHQLAVQS